MSIKSLLAVAFCVIPSCLPLGPEAIAQMYEKDGIMLNSEGGNIFGDSIINPMADPVINPMADPVINPMADPVINPMADPLINPMGDAYIKNDGTMGLKSQDR